MAESPITNTVLTLLARLGINAELEAGSLTRIHYGSAVVTLETAENPATVAVRARVLAEVEIADSDSELRILRALNSRNARSRFGKFFLDREAAEITLEYEILGGFLQQEELLNALQAVAQTADDHDDLLIEELGTGRRASDIGGRAEAATAL